MLCKTWKINEFIFPMGKPFEIYFFPKESPLKFILSLEGFEKKSQYMINSLCSSCQDLID